MRVKNALLFLLICFPLILILISFKFLPDQIPLHYDFRGEVTRYGSKLELFIVPLLMFPIEGIFFLLFQKSNEENRKTFYTGLLVMILTSIASTVWILYIAFNGVTNLYEDLSIEMRALIILLSVGLIVLGNYLPKCKTNLWYGIRTPWTLCNKHVWYKTHRLGARLLILEGIMLLIVSFFLSIKALYSVFLISILSLVVICYIYSFYIYKKEAE